jgi:hypothetical protein
VAKKSRTPAPPRPVQSPKQRKDPRDPRRTRLWLAVASGVLLLVAAGAALAFTFGRGGGDEAQAGACEVQTLAAQGQKHVPPAKIPKDFEYNSFPPASGPHNPQTLIFTEYTEPVPQNRLLHNLEHGGVGAQYGPDVPEETVDQLIAWYRTDPRGLILAPLPDDEKAADLRDKIVLNAWVAERENEDDPQSRILKQEGKLAVCSTFDEDAFNDFLERYRAKGPEGFQLDQLAPGSQ